MRALLVGIVVAAESPVASHSEVCSAHRTLAIHMLLVAETPELASAHLASASEPSSAHEFLREARPSVASLAASDRLRVHAFVASEPGCVASPSGAGVALQA